MKRPSEIAMEYVRVINTLNVPGFIMSSHDLGKEAMARAIIAIVDARTHLEIAKKSNDGQEVKRAEDLLTKAIGKL